MIFILKLLNNWSQWIPREQVPVLELQKIRLLPFKKSTLKFWPWFSKIWFGTLISFPTLAGRDGQGRVILSFAELSQIHDHRKSFAEALTERFSFENSCTFNNIRIILLSGIIGVELKELYVVYLRSSWAQNVH